MLKTLKRSLSPLDGPLCLALFVLCALAFVILASASSLSAATLKKQIFLLIMATGVLILTANIPVRLYYRWAPWAYAIGLVMLIGVLSLGVISKGAQRWINLGFIRFQPAELMKFAVPLMVAFYFHSRQLPPSWKDYLITAGIIFVPALLIAKQPDLGTAFLVASSGCFVLFFAGISWRLLAGMSLVGILCAPLGWWLLHDYQRERILTFLSPERDPLGSGYHIIQSKIAIGSGGVWGKGWLEGTQSHLQFLPERTTDFIFAVTGEEFGFVGVCVLFVVYLITLLRSFHLATQAETTFSRLMAGSIVLTFFIYIFVNTGMVSGLLPVVGVPLPLVSYGGTSLLTLMAGFGMLMALQAKTPYQRF